MGENRVLTPAKVGARCYSTFEPASSNFCMTIDVFVLQIMISGEIQAVNIGNTRLVPGFPQGSNSLEKASALDGFFCSPEGCLLCVGAVVYSMPYQ